MAWTVGNPLLEGEVGSRNPYDEALSTSARTDVSDNKSTERLLSAGFGRGPFYDVRLHIQHAAPKDDIGTGKVKILKRLDVQNIINVCENAINSMNRGFRQRTVIENFAELYPGVRYFHSMHYRYDNCDDMKEELASSFHNVVMAALSRDFNKMFRKLFCVHPDYIVENPKIVSSVAIRSYLELTRNFYRKREELFAFSADIFFLEGQEKTVREENTKVLIGRILDMNTKLFARRGCCGC